jgi:hypothetical protein
VWTVLDAANYRIVEFRSRDEAGVQLRLALVSLLDQPRLDAVAGPVVDTALVGHLSSFRIEADVVAGPDGRNDIALRVDTFPVEPVLVARSDLTVDAITDVIAELESRINTIPETAACYRAEELALRQQEARIVTRLDRPFEHQGRVDAVRSRLRDLEDLLRPPETRATPGPSGMASIRRLPYRPRPDDPTTVTEYDDCPMCLSSDLRSIGEDAGNQVRCKECGWVGSYPPHPRLVALRNPPSPAPDSDPNVSADMPSIATGTAEHVGIGARLTPSSSTPDGATEGPYAPALQSNTGISELGPGPAPTQGGPAPALPSIHQEHQLHQQLYPGPQPAPIVVAP